MTVVVWSRCHWRCGDHAGICTFTSIKLCFLLFDARFFIRLCYLGNQLSLADTAVNKHECVIEATYYKETRYRKNFIAPWSVSFTFHRIVFYPKMSLK